MKPNPKGRRDHYLPQGYLRGFIDPSRTNLQKPLWHLDIRTSTWLERSTREVGYRHGFYDYATDAVGFGSADKSFAGLENSYPHFRRDLISRNFEDWKRNHDFLLRFIQMMRANSLLFFDQKHKEGKALRVMTVEEVYPDRNSVKVSSMTPSPLPDEIVRNRVVIEMCAEIEKGASWLDEFNWALRYCESPATPFIISEIPFMASGHHIQLAEALKDTETLLFFPLC